MSCTVNLTPAVKRVVFRSRSREENPRWRSFHEYYGFSPFYCEPGLRGAHEKGGVEGQVGYFCRNYLTPVPRADSLADLNAQLTVFEAKEERRRIGARIRAIEQDFAREAPHLLPLPDTAFPTGDHAHAARGPLRPDHREDVPVLRPGPLHRPQGHRHADRRGAGWPSPRSVEAVIAEEVGIRGVQATYV
jgi:hypothetical protein